MQILMASEKTQHLFEKANNKGFVSNSPIIPLYYKNHHSSGCITERSIQEPPRKMSNKEKIKLQYKENKKETQEMANLMIKNFSDTKDSARGEQIFCNEMNIQQMSFRDRLERKKTKTKRGRSTSPQAPVSNQLN